MHFIKMTLNRKKITRDITKTFFFFKYIIHLINYTLRLERVDTSPARARDLNIGRLTDIESPRVKRFFINAFGYQRVLVYCTYTFNYDAADKLFVHAYHSCLTHSLVFHQCEMILISHARDTTRTRANRILILS